MKAVTITVSTVEKAWENLCEVNASIGLPVLDMAQIEQLAGYLQLLVKWNKVMNLVGPYDWQDILRLLLVDSFYLASFLDKLPLPEMPICWDPGAGAGLPGIPLRMVWQRGEYTLIESREKRALFLQTVLASCHIQNTRVFRGRLEKFMPDQPKADLVVSRAFLPWEQVLDLVAAHLQPSGVCVFLALQDAPAGIYGWSVLHEQKYHVGDDVRFFWAITKQN